MGCWNGTCLLSNLPICRGDSVVGMFVAYILNPSSDMRQTIGRQNYPSDVAEPIGVPFRGKYDNYGSITDIKYGVTTDYILSVLKESDFDSTLNNISNMKQSIYASSLKRNVGVGLVMFHEKLFDNTVSECKSDFISAIRDSVKLADESRKSDPMVKDTLSELHIIGIIPASGLWFPLKYSDIFTLFDMAEQKYDDLDSEIELIIGAMEDRVKIDIMLNRLRKSWVSGSGVGSQDTSYEAHMILNKVIHAQILEGMKREKEDG